MTSNHAITIQDEFRYPKNGYFFNTCIYTFYLFRLENYDFLHVTSFCSSPHYKDNDVPPGAIISQRYVNLFFNNIYLITHTWSLQHHVTIKNIHHFQNGLNWKSKIFILFFKAKLNIKHTKHMCQHVDEPNWVDIFFYNHHQKLFYKQNLKIFLQTNNLHLIHVC